MFVFPVHPCDKPTKGGCSQDCVKKGETFVCTCKIPDFKLNDDGKSNQDFVGIWTAEHLDDSKYTSREVEDAEQDGDAA